MQLVLRRDQRGGLLGKMVFTLDVRAQITDDERNNIRKYRLGQEVIYASHEMTDRGSGLLGVASRLAWKMKSLTITVDDLAGGKRVEVKDVTEMLAIEDQIREAAQTFKAVLDAAAQFGGEEVIEI